MADLTIRQYEEKLHNIYLTGEVNEDMWKQFVDSINEMKSSDSIIDTNNLGTLALIGLSDITLIHPEVNIYLTTYGGCIYDMFGIYDEIVRLKQEYIVNIYCVSKVMSAGTIIMLAADYKNRFAYKNTTFMFHTLSGWAIGKVKDIEENTEESKRLHKKMFEIYKQETNIPQDKLDEVYKCKKDWYLSAEQAKKYKIISKII